MKRKTIDINTKIRTLIVLLFVTANYSCAQTKACHSIITPDIENNSVGVDTSNILKDTLSNKLELIFEQSFNDTVIVLVDGGKLMYEKAVKTRDFLGVCDSTFSINYNGFKRIPEVSIFLKNKKECISFQPVLNKRLAYINKIQGGWSVELTNYIREYR